MTKAKRQSLILELLGKYDVSTQEELASRLRDAGCCVTQATVSRDIKELRRQKAISDDVSTYRYATVAKAKEGLQHRFLSILGNSVLSVEGCGNIIVVKTITGTASAAGEAIDSMNFHNVVGSIAGDNTIFIAVNEPANAPDIIAAINNYLH